VGIIVLKHLTLNELQWLTPFGCTDLPSILTPLRCGLSWHPFALLTSLRQNIVASLDAWWVYRQKLDDVICRWVQSLTPEQLASVLSYANMAGKVASKRFGYLVQHFFNHQTHHRGQDSTLLYKAGIDVGVTDLLAVTPNEV